MIFVLLILAAFAPLTTLAQTKFVKSVPTLTELRALNVADIHTNVLVNSYWTSNTNSIGAIFQWVPGATDTTNTYSVFAPASGSGRWFRVEMPANPGSASQPGFRFFDNQRSGWFSGLGTNIIAAATDGTERWRIGSTGILQANGAQTVQTSSGTLTVQPAGTTVLGSTSGSTGIGTTGPDRKLDVLDASGSAQFRTTYTDGSVYTDYQTLSGGSTLISDSSGRMINSTIVNNTAVSARARHGGLAFDGVTNAKDLHTIGANIGTSDFSVSMTVLVPSSNPSSNIGLIGISSSATSTGVDGGFNIYIGTDGSLNVFTRAATGATSLYGTLTGFISSHGGRVVSVVFARNATIPSMTCYVNGVAQTLTESGGASPTTWAQSINSTYVFFGQSNTSEYFNSTIYSAQLFTRALSASEVVDLANKGVSEGDKWASLTAKYSSDFSAGTDSWAITTGLSALDGNIDGIGGQNDNLRLTSDATTGNHRAQRTSTLTVGKRYRVDYSYYMPVASNVTAKKFFLADANVLESFTPVDSTWTARSVEFVAASSILNFYMATSGGSFNFSGTSGDLLYIRGVTVTEIGCLLDADLAVGVGYQAPDLSSNHYDGLISTSGVSHVIEQRRGQARFSLSADGYLGDTTSRACIPADAVIESIVCYSTGTPTFTIGDDSGAATNLQGSTTLTASTVTYLTPLKRFATTGTKGRIYVDFTAGAAATTFTVNYSTTGNY